MVVYRLLDAGWKSYVVCARSVVELAEPIEGSHPGLSLPVVVWQRLWLVGILPPVLLVRGCIVPRDSGLRVLLALRLLVVS